jgi:hypothetical protein
MRIALILGSASDVVRAKAWPRKPIDHMVVINNAWQVRNDWDYLIYPDDFPAERMPPSIDAQRQKVITSEDYVPVQNSLGGFVYAGATMAFTAGYWALGALKPDVIAYLGCDMHYETPQTHFYGAGTADPLRTDVTLQSLEAKSARLMVTAAQHQCLCLNLSELPVSRQVFSRADYAQLGTLTPQLHAAMLGATQSSFDTGKLQAAKQLEAELNYTTASGRYWEAKDQFDATRLRQLDALWLAAVKVAPGTAPPSH